MINICIYCNPNYSKEHRIQSSDKSIDLVSQAIILYNSINKNWKNLDYDIYLFRNKNIKWSKTDENRINKLLNLNVIDVEFPDHPRLPWQTRIPCFTYPLNRIGSHRLVLDCDMIALNEPSFDLSCDWQAMFSPNANLPHFGRKGRHRFIENCGQSKKSLNCIDTFIKNHNIYALVSSDIDQNTKKDKLHIDYNKDKNIWRKLFPVFNMGALLIKEQLCKDFAINYEKGYKITFEGIRIVRHSGIEFIASFILLKLSSNWKPFEPGFNYLSSLFSLEYTKKNLNTISLIHYANTPKRNGYKYLSNIDNSYLFNNFL